MSKEFLDVYDDELKYIGTMSREETHQKGHWHYTFHCWIILPSPDGKYYILFQKRHPAKEVNPGKLSISAAGHILAGETVEDGVREVKEEVGVDIPFSEMKPISEYKIILQNERFYNREISLLYYTVQQLRIEDFTPQLSEVSGLFLVSIDRFYELMYGEKDSVEGLGYDLLDPKRSYLQPTLITKKHFSSKGLPYFQFVSRYLQRKFTKEKAADA
ncbi:hypothetical protein CN918_25355 [Priestia megaterium]|nr:hypothetical protein CN918_25355 [Priestia megaterium]